MLQVANLGCKTYNLSEMETIGTFLTAAGDVVNLRLINKNDAALLVDFFHRLSPESKRLRFHLYTTKIPEEKIWE